ncbi:TRAP transporter small permease [Verticiella sediminum]|uniref:TRAP transporter small permease protein n=1 Tax=Verticiella sediminum TaxID=1247510 RepID=A0A556AWZ1_9BURK|nr:TRAP transporter small permease [Verticiella sediminum]TSH97450.1 TRAP transporter small permease [Verticiella sediminum]
MPHPSDKAAAANPGLAEADVPALLAQDEEPQVRVPLAIEDWLSAGLLGLLAVMTMANVLVRYFTSQSFAWTEEISIVLMIVMTLVASSAAVARNRHIRIEYFAERGSPERRRRLVRFAAGCVALMFWLLAVLSARITYDQYIYGDTSPAIGVPEWWYSVWMPLLSLAIALRAVGVWRRA